MLRSGFGGAGIYKIAVIQTDIGKLIGQRFLHTGALLVVDGQPLPQIGKRRQHIALHAVCAVKAREAPVRGIQQRAVIGAVADDIEIALAVPCHPGGLKYKFLRDQVGFRQGDLPPHRAVLRIQHPRILRVSHIKLPCAADIQPACPGNIRLAARGIPQGVHLLPAKRRIKTDHPAAFGQHICVAVGIAVHVQPRTVVLGHPQTARRNDLLDRIDRRHGHRPLLPVLQGLVGKRIRMGGTARRNGQKEQRTEQKPRHSPPYSLHGQPFLSGKTVFVCRRFGIFNPLYPICSWSR